MDFALKRMILNSNCVATYGNGMNRYVAGFIEDNTGTCYCHAVFGNTFDEAFCYVQQFIGDPNLIWHKSDNTSFRLYSDLLKNFSIYLFI